MTHYCENCGCDVQEVVQVFPGHLRKECAECGSTGPFMVENPHYGPGNPDFERDRVEDEKITEEEHVRRVFARHGMA